MLPSRPALRRLAGALALAGLAVSAAAADKKPMHTVQDPHWGDGLFYFWQDRYFTAITTLMASQHFERLPQHADEAEVLRGGMLLSYGLHEEAGRIFAQLIEKNAAPPVRDRAWYYLAKIRYQRGYIDQALDAVAKIEKNLPPALEEERLLLHSNLLMAKEDYAGAAQLLAGIDTKSGASPYARFNLGVALVRTGEQERGAKLLDEIGKAPAENEEMRTLRDKANVALGFSALQSEQPEAARASLERVRLASLHSNKALLGFGWAAAALKKPQEALVPWMELMQRDGSDAAVLEARIAVPYAYAEIGAYGQALARYTDAIEWYDKERVKLDESIAAIRGGKLLDGLADKNPGAEMGWFWNIDQLPELPHPGHLSQVLAEHEFQEAFKNWRDLRFLSANLEDWDGKLGVFTDMLDNRKKAYAERLPQVRSQAGGLDIEGLQKRRDALAAELAQAESSQDALAFATVKERELLERITQGRETLKRAGSDPDLADAAERLRRATGALTWELTQAYSGRVWEAKKSLKQADAGLADARDRDAALAQAQKDEPARHEAFAKRIAELRPRLAALMPRVASLSREQQQQVQELAVAALERQKDRLTIYAQQARFAVAQLYDRATVAKKEDDAARKP